MQPAGKLWFGFFGMDSRRSPGKVYCYFLLSLHDQLSFSKLDVKSKNIWNTTGSEFVSLSFRSTILSGERKKIRLCPRLGEGNKIKCKYFLISNLFYLLLPYL